MKGPIVKNTAKLKDVAKRTRTACRRVKVIVVISQKNVVVAVRTVIVTQTVTTQEAQDPPLPLIPQKKLRVSLREKNKRSRNWSLASIDLAVDLFSTVDRYGEDSTAVPKSSHVRGVSFNKRVEHVTSERTISDGKLSDNIGNTDNVSSIAEDASSVSVEM